MYNSEGEREREWEETKKQPDVINFQFVYSCRPFSILCSFCSFSSLALSLCLSNHHPLFRILIVRYAFLCVCVPFEKQQKDNTIRRYGNKNIFFLQTEHRLMTMAAWAIKSRIFTSLKRALNFVETFFYGNFTSDWNFKQFPAPFLFMNEKVDFSTRIDSCLLLSTFWVIKFVWICIIQSTIFINCNLWVNKLWTENRVHALFRGFHREWIFCAHSMSFYYQRWCIFVISFISHHGEHFTSFFHVALVWWRANLCEMVMEFFKQGFWT